MPNFFIDKNVVITGASSGIGYTLSYWYLNNGANVALVGRDIDALERMAKEYPSQAVAIQCDFGFDQQISDLFSTVIEKLGGVDILINAAGLIFAGDIENAFP